MYYCDCTLTGRLSSNFDCWAFLRAADSVPNSSPLRADLATCAIFHPHTALFPMLPLEVPMSAVRKGACDQTAQRGSNPLNHINFTAPTFIQGSSYLVHVTAPRTSRMSGGWRDGVMTDTVVECLAAKAARSYPPCRPSESAVW